MGVVLQKREEFKSLKIFDFEVLLSLLKLSDFQNYIFLIKLDSIQF
jgi:hypothetical protein